MGGYDVDVVRVYDEDYGYFRSYVPEGGEDSGALPCGERQDVDGYLRVADILWRVYGQADNRVGCAETRRGADQEFAEIVLV